MFSAWPRQGPPSAPPPVEVPSHAGRPQAGLPGSALAHRSQRPHRPPTTPEKPNRPSPARSRCCQLDASFSHPGSRRPNTSSPPPLDEPDPSRGRRGRMGRFGRSRPPDRRAIPPSARARPIGSSRSLGDVSLMALRPLRLHELVVQAPARPASRSSWMPPLDFPPPVPGSRSDHNRGWCSNRWATIRQEHPRRRIPSSMPSSVTASSRPGGPRRAAAPTGWEQGHGRSRGVGAARGWKFPPPLRPTTASIAPAGGW